LKEYFNNAVLIQFVGQKIIIIFLKQLKKVKLKIKKLLMLLKNIVFFIYSNDIFQISFEYI